MGRRKKRSRGGGISLILIVILIGLMAYSAFLLYNFAKKQNLISFNLPVIQGKPTETNNNGSTNQGGADKKKNSNTQSESVDSGTQSVVTNIPTVTQSSQTTTNIVTPKVEQGTTQKPKTITEEFYLYLARLDGNEELYLTKIRQSVSFTDSPVFATINTLTAYQAKEPYINLVPKGTKILSAWIKEGILFLNFNDAFLNNQDGYKSIETQIYQIVNTACQFENVKGVFFLINGKILKYYSDEGFMLDIIFKPNV